MSYVELLTVEEAISLGRNGPGGLILHPTFPVPAGWNHNRWKGLTEPVLIARPDGEQIEATAHIGLSYPHRNTRHTNSVSYRGLRLTIWLSDCTEQEVPVGSRILVSQEVRTAILPDEAG
jgi:hypothetical protein